MPQNHPRPNKHRPRPPPFYGLDLIAPPVYAPSVGLIPPQFPTPNPNLLGLHEDPVKQTHETPTSSGVTGSTSNNVSAEKAPRVQEPPRTTQAPMGLWPYDYGYHYYSTGVGSHLVPPPSFGRDPASAGVGEPREQPSLRQPVTPREDAVQAMWGMNGVSPEYMEYYARMLATKCFAMTPSMLHGYPFGYSIPPHMAPIAAFSQVPQAYQPPQQPSCHQGAPGNAPQQKPTGNERTLASSMPSSSGVPKTNTTQQPKESVNQQEPQPKKSVNKQEPQPKKSGNQQEPQPKKSGNQQEPQPKRKPRRSKPKRSAQPASPQEDPAAEKTVSAALSKQMDKKANVTRNSEMSEFSHVTRNPEMSEFSHVTRNAEMSEFSHVTRNSDRQPPAQNESQQKAQTKDSFSVDACIDTMAEYFEQQADLARKKRLLRRSEENEKHNQPGASHVPSDKVAISKVRVDSTFSLYMSKSLTGHTSGQQGEQRQTTQPLLQHLPGVTVPQNDPQRDTQPRKQELQVQSSSDREGSGKARATFLTRARLVTSAHSLEAPQNQSKQNIRPRDVQVPAQPSQPQKIPRRETPRSHVPYLQGAAAAPMQVQLNQKSFRNLVSSELQIIPVGRPHEVSDLGQRQQSHGTCERAPPEVIILDDLEEQQPGSSTRVADQSSLQDQQNPNVVSKRGAYHEPSFNEVDQSPKAKRNKPNKMLEELNQEQRTRHDDGYEADSSQQQRLESADEDLGQSQTGGRRLIYDDNDPLDVLMKMWMAIARKQKVKGKPTSSQQPDSGLQLQNSDMSGLSSLLPDSNSQPQNSDMPKLSYLQPDSNSQLQNFDMPTLSSLQPDSNLQLKNSDLPTLPSLQPDSDSQLQNSDMPTFSSQQPYSNSQLRNSDMPTLPSQPPYSNSQLKDSDMPTLPSQQPYSNSQLKSSDMPTLPSSPDDSPPTPDRDPVHGDMRQHGQDDSVPPQRPTTEQELSVSTWFKADARKPFCASDGVFGSDDLATTLTRRYSCDSDEGRLIIVLDPESEPEPEAEDLNSERDQSLTVTTDMPPKMDTASEGKDSKLPEVLQRSHSCEEDGKCSEGTESCPSTPFDYIDGESPQFGEREVVVHEYQMHSPEIETQRAITNLPSPSTQRNQKFREIFEKEFSDIRRAREEKERQSRMHNRSQGNEEDGDTLENDAKYAEHAKEQRLRRSAAKIPELLKVAERRNHVVLENGLVQDFAAEYKKLLPDLNWSNEERAIFKTNYIQYPKLFEKIASTLPRRNMFACVRFYYLSKHKERYRRLVPKRNNRSSLGLSAGSMRRKHPPAVECFKCRAPLQTAAEKKGSRLVSKKNCADYGLTVEQLLSSEYRACFDCRSDSSDTAFLCPIVECQKRAVRTCVIPPAWRPAGTRGRIKECCENCFARLESKYGGNEWTTEEVNTLIQAVRVFGFDWAAVASAVGTKNGVLCERYYRLNVENSTNPVLMHENSTYGSTNYSKKEGSDSVADREASLRCSNERSPTRAEGEVHGIPKIKVILKSSAQRANRVEESHRPSDEPVH